MARKSEAWKRGLVDTNVLVYAFASTGPHHAASRELRDRGLVQRDLLVLCPQVLLEFYRTVSDPRRLHPSVTAPVALREMAKLRAAFETAYPGERTHRVFEELLAKHRPTGARVFDIYVAATALAFEIPRIYTFNVADFAGIDGLEAVTP